jgi:hypothetical protein
LVLNDLPDSDSGMLDCGLTGPVFFKPNKGLCNEALN